MCRGSSPSCVILHAGAWQRENPEGTEILTNFYKEFIYVYRIFRAGLHKNRMDGVGIVLSISLHDFSGKQQPQIRNSTHQEELYVIPTYPVINRTSDDKGCHEQLVTKP